MVTHGKEMGTHSLCFESGVHAGLPLAMGTPSEEMGTLCLSVPNNCLRQFCVDAPDAKRIPAHESGASTQDCLKQWAHTECVPISEMGVPIARGTPGWTHQTPNASACAQQLLEAVRCGCTKLRAYVRTLRTIA